MTRIDLVDLPEMTTRRRVVKAGAKLVYAAPLVVASMRVSRLGASAQQVVSGAAWPGEDKGASNGKQKEKHENDGKHKGKHKGKPANKGRNK